MGIRRSPRRPNTLKISGEKKELIISLIKKCEAKRMSGYMVKEYHRLNNLKKCRLIDGHLNPTIISMEIKDDMEQTLESLAVRIGSMYQYDFDDLMRYLTENKERLYYYQAVPGAILKYDRIKWTPGINSDAYDLFMAL